MISKSKMKLINTAVDVELVPTIEANALGFFAKTLVQVTLPHSDPKRLSFKRESGPYSLTIRAHEDEGMPYGTYPRLIICYLVTEIIKTKDKRVELGNCFADFLRAIKINPNSNARKKVKQQMKRLFSAGVSARYNNADKWKMQNMYFAHKAELWWDEVNPEQLAFDESYVEVSEYFYNMAMEAFPVDMRILEALKKSPMALDIYMWLTFRMSHLKDPVTVSWDQLYKQFGEGEIADLDNFRTKFKAALTKVKTAYRSVRFGIKKEGILLMPSATSVQKLVESVKSE